MLVDLQLAELNLTEANWSTNGFQSGNTNLLTKKSASLISGGSISGTLPTTGWWIVQIKNVKV